MRNSIEGEQSDLSRSPRLTDPRIGVKGDIPAAWYAPSVSYTLAFSYIFLILTVSYFRIIEFVPLVIDTEIIRKFMI